MIIATVSYKPKQVRKQNSKTYQSYNYYKNMLNELKQIKHDLQLRKQSSLTNLKQIGSPRSQRPNLNLSLIKKEFGPASERSLSRISSDLGILIENQLQRLNKSVRINSDDDIIQTLAIEIDSILEEKNNCIACKLKTEKVKEKLKSHQAEVLSEVEKISEIKTQLKKYENLLKKREKNLNFAKLTILTEKTDESDEFINTDTDDYFLEIEEARNKLTNLVEENCKYKRTSAELKMSLEELDQSNSSQSALISVLETKIVRMESAIYNKVELTQKLSIEKDVLSSKVEDAHSKKLELERILNDKLAESEDLRFQVKIHVGDEEISTESTDLIEQLKNKLMNEQQKYKKNQTEMQSLQFRLGQALQELTKEKKGEENELLNREIMARNEKIKLLEDELDFITENHRSVKRILSEDEETLNERTNELEKNLEQLTNMYKQLLARQSSVNIEKQLNLRKVTRLNETIKKLEEDLKMKKEQLVAAESEANKILDDIASQSIFNRIRVPIKGGGGKGFRASMANRLSIKSNRTYASMVAGNS